jgi:hypothetical protein
MKALDAIDDRRPAAVEVRPQAQAAFVVEMNRMAQGTVWTAGGCKSLVSRLPGNASTIWPYFTFRFRRRTKRFDVGDYQLIPHSTPAPTTTKEALTV